MPYRLKTPMPCEQCGQLTDKGKRPNKPRLCFDCGLMNAQAGAREMANKSGVAWSNYLASNAPGARTARGPN